MKKNITNFIVAVLLIIVSALLVENSFKKQKIVKLHNAIDNSNSNFSDEKFAKYTEIHNRFGRQIIKHDDVAIVTYAGGKPQYYNDIFNLNISAHDHGIDRVLTYSPKDID